MRLNSLAVRLVAGAAVWSVAALAAGGIALSSLFADYVERGFESHLALLLDALTAAAEVGADRLPYVANPPAEPRFDAPYSGRYWQMTKGEEVLLRSRSLWDLRLPAHAASDRATGITFHDADGPEGQRLRVAKQVVHLPGAEQPYIIEVGADLGPSRAEIARFNRLLAWALGLMGLGLVVAVLIQVHFGLAPLRQLSANLAAIRAGGASRLDEKLPAELAPLAAELNRLVDGIFQVVERARTQVGNLAHGLKTPLSVLANEAREADGPLAAQVERQTEVMRRLVEHQLSRARAAAMSGVLGVRTEVAPVARDIARTLERIHGPRGITFRVACPDRLAFAGEAQDLEEMLGNLLDNASKWAAKQVSVRAEPLSGKLRILVEDDGPGLDEAGREAVLKRGTRLDETVAGSGLGLGIVGDLVELYNGRLSLERAPLGGLRVSLELPLAL
jgi:signal transduction histidine kinase